ASQGRHASPGGDADERADLPGAGSCRLRSHGRAADHLDGDAPGSRAEADRRTRRARRAGPAAGAGPGAARLTAAAFFDLDRTLMAGSSAYHFGRAMYKAGQMSRRQIFRDARDQIRFRLRGASDAAVNVL